MVRKEGRHSEQLKRVVVREELVALTGSGMAAVILGQMLYWSERTRDVDKYIVEEMARDPEAHIVPTHGWIYKSATELAEEIMLGVSDATVGRCLSALVEKGWLLRRRNPRYKWDRTWQYRADIQQIQRDLYALGYSLEAYPLIGQIESAPTILQNAESVLQNAESVLQNDGLIEHSAGSNTHCAEAIPETISKTTSKTTSKIRTKNDYLVPHEKEDTTKDTITSKGESKRSPRLELDLPQGEDTPTDPVTRACDRVFLHWVKVAGHIHCPRESSAPALKKKIAGKVRRWGAPALLRAIDHYVQAYDDPTFYYDHKWTLPLFLQQRNGAPQWEEGLDDEYDGKLWREYQEKASTKAIPTRTRTRLSATPDGDKAIAKRFPDDVRRKAFLQKCHGPAVVLADLDQGGEQAVTKALLDVHARIDTAWDRLPKNLQTLADLGPLRVLECFIDWLGEQEWISRRGPSMFTNEKLFTSFYREYMQNLGIHAGDYTGPDGRAAW